MDIFVISDTHIPERIGKLPNKFMKQLQQGDILFHCGDFTSIDIYDQLQQSAHLHAVIGNMDDFALTSTLKSQLIIDINGKKIGVMHGWGSSVGLEERIYDAFDEKPDVILFGHSHSRLSKKINNTLMFNPGAVTGGWDSQPSFGKLFIDSGAIRGEHYFIESR